MKAWQFWVIILVVIFVVVPIIYFAIIANSVTKISKSNGFSNSGEVLSISNIPGYTNSIQ